MHAQQMRPSRVLQKLRRGQIVNCFKTNIDSGRVTEIAGLTGFDCVWVDLEHTSSDWSVVESQVLAGKAYDMDVMVRVSRGGYSDYIKPLELDASGIMIPHVMGLEDARFVARTTRFHPIGRRPVDGGNADGAFCNISLDQYVSQANSQRFVVIQIEDPEPMDELDAIAKVPGIDMLFFGPGDFSHGIGAAGRWNDPRIASARKQVAEAAIRHGKFAGTVGSADTLDELIGTGYRFINIAADVTALSQYCHAIMDKFNRALAKGEIRNDDGKETANSG